MTQQACVISQLTLEFPSKVMFKELNFSLEHHQVSALIGRNGQGKSSLMQLLHKISPTTEMHMWSNKLANKPCIFISAHSSPIRHNCRSFRGQPSLQRFSKSGTR